MKKNYLLTTFLTLSLALAGSSAAYAQYCTTGLYSYGCAYGDFVNSVSTTGGTTNITNNSTGCASGYTGYSNYTSVGSVTVQTGSSFALTVVNGSWSEWYSIYVDFNSDGDWSDPGETVYTTSSAKEPANSTVSGAPITINVPSTATTGATRMRIRCVYYPSVASSACSFQYGGEAEDYTVNIVPSCPAPVITSQPQNRLTCEGNTATFNVAATNVGSYQWQVNAGSGWSNVSGTVYTGGTTNSLTISGMNTTYNGFQYRCVVTGNCNNPVNSNAVTLTVNPGAAIVSHTPDRTICEGAVTSLDVNAIGTISSYEWEMAASTAGVFTTVPSSPPFTGVNTSTLNIVGVPQNLNGYLFRCNIIGGQCPDLYTATIPFTVITPPAFIEPPQHDTIQPNADALFEVKVTPGALVQHYWQASADGINFYNINNNSLYDKVLTPTLLVKAAPLAMANWWFRCIIKSTDPECGLFHDTSDAAQLRMIVETGVGNIVANSDVKIYPNPVSGNELFISTGNITGALHATIIDKLGRVLLSAEVDMNNKKAATLQVGQLTPGIYSLRLTDAEGKPAYTGTFTKQ